MSRAEQFSANVRAEMARTRIPQSVLASALGVTQQAVSNRLRGVTDFKVDELDVVADVLGVPVSALLGGAAAAVAS